VNGHPALSVSESESPGCGQSGHVPLDGLLRRLGADAERLLVGISVYRQPADRNAVLFQIGRHDWTAARAPGRRGPAPPYQAPASLDEMLAACTAAGALTVGPGPAGAGGTADGHTVFVEPWLASELHRMLATAGRGAELVCAHQRAAAYWQWRSAAWPQSRRADIHDLLEARHHLFDAGDTDQASALTESVCAQLHAWGDLGREAALIHETLSRLPARSSRRAGWIYELGRIAEVRRDYASAEHRYQQALDLFAALGDRSGVSRSYHSLGVLAQAQGDYPRAERRYQQSSDAAEQHAAGTGTAAAEQHAAGTGTAAAEQHAAGTGTAAAEQHAASDSPATARPPAASDSPATARPPAANDSSAAAPCPAPVLCPVPVMVFGPSTGSGSAAGSGPATGSGSATGARRVSGLKPVTAGGPAGPGPRRLAGAAARPAMTPVTLPRRVARTTAGPRPEPAPGSGHRRQARPAPGWRLPVLTALAVMLAAFGAVRISGAFRSPRAGLRLTYSTAASTAGAVRREAAVWVTRQVARSAIIACDPAMCSALHASGVPAGNLLALGPNGLASPVGSNVVLATAAVRSLFGARLAGVYAPTVIAAFGTGGSLIQVRVVAPDGSAAYLRELRSDRLARRKAGAQLLLNKRVVSTVTARRQLSAGLVDSRLLTTLAALAQMRPLRIVSFSPSGPGASAGLPLPVAVLTVAGPVAGAGYLRPLLAFLRAQQPPFLAASEQPEQLSNGQEALRVKFADPGPLGLLSAGDSSSSSTTPP
jgi:tetratricopeptide (TPR) repeat protein